MSVQVRRVYGLASVGVTLLALVGCGSPVTGQPGPTVESSANSSSTNGSIDAVNPCTLLTSQDLGQLGVRTQSTPSNAAGETGCRWLGEDLYVSLTKAKDGLDYFTQHPQKYVNLVQNTVNGRPGLHVQISQSNTECSQVMAVGTGYLRVGLGYAGKSGDPCAQALQIAQTVEPKLPK